MSLLVGFHFYVFFPHSRRNSGRADGFGPSDVGPASARRRRGSLPTPLHPPPYTLCTCTSLGKQEMKDADKLVSRGSSNNARKGSRKQDQDEAAAESRTKQQPKAEQSSSRKLRTKQQQKAANKAAAGESRPRRLLLPSLLLLLLFAERSAALSRACCLPRSSASRAASRPHPQRPALVDAAEVSDLPALHRQFSLPGILTLVSGQS